MHSPDEDFERVFAHLASLKAHRNSIAPIFRLPTELLVEISLRLSDLPCKTITKVCRHWHAISSATPALWTRVELDLWNQQRFLSQMRLSGGLPLTISIRMLDSPRAASLVLEHAGRIASLSILGRVRYVLHFMHEMRHFAFPLLRSLVLDPFVNDDEIGIDGNNVMPPKLLDPDEIGIEGNNGHHCLRQLEVFDIDGSWQSLRALQSLSLLPAVGLPFHTLLAVLAECPEMRVLDLDMATGRALPGRCHPVRLPCLERLVICDRTAVCVDLLAHLVFPHTTCLDLIPQAVHCAAELHDIMDAVHRHLRAQDTPAIRMMHIAGPASINDPEYYFAITTLAAVDSIARFDSVEEDARFAVTTYPEDNCARTEIMELVLSALATQNITHLNIVDAALTLAPCKVALTLLPALETITLMLGETGTCFCEAVLDSESAHTLRGINVYARVPADAAEHTDSFIDMLGRLLDSCRQSGRPLLHLRVEVAPFNDVTKADELWDKDEYQAYEAKWAGIRCLVGEFVWEKLESSFVQ
ncbi:hypothetical protein GGX14DRAFT_475377 [Mycena pura]|uniref:F-box domain-containing protein n=1 Tax=Mycena pura TaxID=153505 RepID=A0AAD6UYN4_9AGAR|nr:hypothetical protein GGX14DRAFT_475377 [Mycena pura]